MGSGAFGNISVAGSAIGSLLSVNNLNDVADINTSLNNILPTQAGNNGKSLVTIFPFRSRVWECVYRLGFVMCGN